jgi:hypothetical protein
MQDVSPHAVGPLNAERVCPQPLLEVLSAALSRDLQLRYHPRWGATVRGHLYLSNDVSKRDALPGVVRTDEQNDPCRRQLDG